MPKQEKTIKPRLALTYIVKDDSEAEFFERSLESFTPYFDGLYVAVTGTSGKHKRLIKLIKKYGGEYIVTYPKSHPEIYHEGKFWNFGAARNVVFDMVPDDYDFISWADVDDVLAGGEELHKVAEEAIRLKADRVFFTYFYSVKLNEKGQIKEVEVDHLKDRLFRPKLFRWEKRLHEVPIPVDGLQPIELVYAFNPQEKREAVWIHLTTHDRLESSLGRNIEILEFQAKEEDYKDPRTLFYLAKCYFEYEKSETDGGKCDNLLDKYIELSGWPEERANAWQFKGHIATRKGDHRAAIDCWMNAAKEYPVHHTTYLRIANAYFQLGMTDYAKHWLNVASTMPAPQTRTTIGQPYEVKILLSALKFHEAQLEGDLAEMEKWARVRADLMEEDDGLLEDVLANKNMNIAANGLLNFAKWLKDAGYATKIEALLESVPDEMSQYPFVGLIASEVAEPKVWGDKEIAYYASFGQKHFEKWGPSSLETGIGGSETAVIELAKEWAKKGYKVTVFCDTDEAGEHEGVIYKPYYLINWKDEFNILILWRSPHLLDRELNAKKLFLDLHDVPAQVMFTPERVSKLDKIFVKSNYHRNLLPAIADEKFAVISNGIRL